MESRGKGHVRRGSGRVSASQREIEAKSRESGRGSGQESVRSDECESERY